jgi:hypothetical protein
LSINCSSFASISYKRISPFSAISGQLSALDKITTNRLHWSE